ncbi:MAG TPA: type II toxin-antitoxin system RelE/ParE family toxin [Xanthobacteraceae bacterium]|nr:type II toxin-antitoxin system RelE/ParE family toxin [Xanthobacteraceae bacterium]
MHTVVETPAYLADAKAAGLTESEREAVVEMIAGRPEAGDEIGGTGGARKVRFAGRGKGKSGGYRVITFYSGKDIPVFLLVLYSKGDKANLSKAERNELKGILADIVREYRKGGKCHV